MHTNPKTEQKQIRKKKTEINESIDQTLCECLFGIPCTTEKKNVTTTTTALHITNTNYLYANDTEPTSLRNNHFFFTSDPIYAKNLN